MNVRNPLGMDCINHLLKFLSISSPIDPLHWLSFSPDEFVKEARKRFLILGLSHDVVHPRVNNCVSVPPPFLAVSLHSLGFLESLFIICIYSTTR